LSFLFAASARGERALCPSTKGLSEVACYENVYLYGRGEKICSP